MALTNFIPEIWSARLLQNLHKSLVYGQPGIVNREYEGEIREAGDTVRINAIGPVTVGTYTRNSDLGTPEVLTDAQAVLTITEAKTFHFQVDDLDKVQQRPQVMDEAMREAAYALADTLDQYIAAMYTEAATANLIGTTASPKTDVLSGGTNKSYDYLVDLSVLLDESNVPSAGRWVVVPPWYHGVLLKDSRFVATGSGQAESRLANAVIGQAAGFTVIKSNNVPNTSAAKYRIIAGHNMAWTMAMQLAKIEAYRPEKRFADAVKGLQLYGAKVIRPQALAVLTANKPS